jgi:hypothetical protein
MVQPGELLVLSRNLRERIDALAVELTRFLLLRCRR